MTDNSHDSDKPDQQADIQAQLQQFDLRLSRIESKLERLANLEVTSEHVDDTLSGSPAKPMQLPPGVSEHDRQQDDYPQSATQTQSKPINPTNHLASNKAPMATVIMGFTAAIAFVLAAIYFVKLVYDAGWLTPGIQIGLACVSGIGLIAAGVMFARHERNYAAYLPAVGVIVLYLAVLAGHVYYGLLSAHLAIAAVALTTLCAMWLAREFDNSIYILFAVVGVYTTPIALEMLRASVLDLVIYYTAWSLLFSYASIHEGRRMPYQLAMLFAIIGFDLAWRISGGGEWELAASYQFVQFLIFAATTYWFSVRHNVTLTGGEAAVHGVGLFYFYGVEYFTLSEHIPSLAPWIALASAVIVLLIYGIAARTVERDGPLKGSAVLASSYASFVTAHVVFFELIPPQYFAWSVLMAPVAARLASGLFKTRAARLPVYLVSGGLLIVGFLGALSGRSFFNHSIPNANILLFVYAGVLYASFYMLRKDLHSARFATLVLYAAHVALLVATLQSFNNNFLISVLWGLYAVILLFYAIKRDDAVVGKSSLLIFAASGLKVLLHDLDGSAPMTRVLVLVVLSVSLYVGGWLYQKVNAVREFTGNPAVDRQISKIAAMAKEGMSSDRIALRLLNQNEVLYGSDEHWTATKVDEIKSTFGL